MAGQRTTVALVLGVLGGNYGSVNGITAELQPFIRRANATVNQVLLLNQKRKAMVALLPDTNDLVIMETWVAAYYYTQNDPQQSNQSTAGASATFVVDSLEANRFKAGAIQSDPSGALNILLNRKFAGTLALGGPSDYGYPLLGPNLP